MIRLLWIVLASVGLATGAPASKTWGNLVNLSARTPIEVVTREHTVKGDLVAVASESLTIRTPLGEQTFPRADVVRVSAYKQSHRLRHVLISAAVGAAAGLVSDQTIGTYLRNESNPPGARAVLWTVPIALGAGIGAALPSHAVIYRK